MMQVELVDEQFSHAYRRNRASRSVYCFPSCKCASKDVDTCDCDGCSIDIDVTLGAGDANDLDLLAVAEFRSVGAKSRVNQMFDAAALTESAHNTGKHVASSFDETAGLLTHRFRFLDTGDHWYDRQLSKNHELHVYILAGSLVHEFFTVVCGCKSPPFEVQDIQIYSDGTTTAWDRSGRISKKIETLRCEVCMQKFRSMEGLKYHLEHKVCMQKATVALQKPNKITVVQDAITSAKTKNALTAGTKVEARFGGDRTYYPGKIESVTTWKNSDSTYAIAYDDGDKETDVARDLIRLRDSPSPPAGLSEAETQKNYYLRKHVCKGCGRSFESSKGLGSHKAKCEDFHALFLRDATYDDRPPLCERLAPGTRIEYLFSGKFEAGTIWRQHRKKR
jgi:hypothetical protein